MAKRKRAVEPCERLAWDSEFFGVETARVRGDSLTAERVKDRTMPMLCNVAADRTRRRAIGPAKRKNRYRLTGRTATSV